MGYYDFPHTRNYDTDLGYLIDWFKTNKNKIEENTAITIEKALTATEEAIKAYNSATSASNSATSASNSAALALELKNLMQAKIDQIDTNTNRINNLATIDQGSITTTADAELVDIRVGANGTTYPSAGDSVRGQVSEVKSDIDDIDTALLNSGLPINYLLESESIKGSVWTNPDGGIYNADGNKRWAEFTVPAGVYEYTNLLKDFSYYKNSKGSGSLVGLPLVVDVDTKIYASANIDIKPTFIRSDDLKTVNIGANRVFKTLTSGINYATSIGNCTVYVDDGIYDIIKEYGGNNYFENLTENEVHQNPGIALGNNVHVIFSSGAKVVCNYTGNNQYVKMHFAPFNADKRLMINGNFILENCICEASNVKYVMHDEYNGFNINYKHIYKNCKFKLDNTNNEYRDSQNSFGGGCGTFGYIELDGCDVTVVPINGVTGLAIAWHNANNNYAGTSVSNNRIFIKNCITNGKILFTAYGNSEEISRMTICNSKFLGEPIHEYINNPPYSTVDNVEIIEWNNTKLS